MTDVDSEHLWAMLTAKDIDEQKREEQKLQAAAKLDKMTMVLNRETTMECIRHILREETNSSHALFMIDADNFKNINDTKELLAAIQKICIEYATVHVSCSIGIGLYPEHGGTLEEIYAQADTALYQAKREGKNQFVIASG